MSNFCFFFFYAVFFVISKQVYCKCEIDIRTNLTSNSPILHVNNKIIRPNDGQYITLKRNDEFTVTCPEPKNSLSVEKKMVGSSAEIKCLDNNKYTYSNEILKPIFEISQLKCKSTPLSKVISVNDNLPFTPACKEKGYIHYVIGYEARPLFLEGYHICYNTNSSEPVLVYSEIHPFLKLKQTFGTGSYFHTTECHKDLCVVYQKATQKANFELLFGKNAQKYNTDSVYFERGHLSARADYIFTFEQQATFYLLNVVPMWNTINNGNWKLLETLLRDLADRNKQTLKVWTGTLGVLTLKNHVTNRDVEIKLKSTRSKADGNFSVVVPKLLYKLIYDEATSYAIVVVTINNPYWEGDEDDVICENILHKIQWLQPMDKFLTKKLGYTYACEYSDFAKKISVFPILPTKLKTN